MIIHRITIYLYEDQHNSPEFIDLTDKLREFCEKEGLKYHWVIEDVEKKRTLILHPVKF